MAAALTQAELRRRAVPKFGDLAARMYFTPDGLEQATRLSVATHRAGRLQAADTRSAVDLGCGIGGDLLAFARAGITAAGVELDPVRVAVAQANLAALGLDGAVLEADATTLDTSPFDVAFADPARRGGRGRTFHVDEWTPPWPFVEDLLRRDACVKVAPGIPHGLVPDGVEAEWVSDRGEVKEAALWSGRLATVARRATVIGDGGLATLTEEDDPGSSVIGVGDLGAFLYEPDGAVIRAGLVTAVAAGVGGWLIDRKIAYVTSDGVLPDTVRAVLPGAGAAAVPREAAARRAAGARHRHADHQEARRRRVTRAAAQAARAARRGRGHAGADAGARRRRRPARQAVLTGHRGRHVDRVDRGPQPGRTCCAAATDQRQSSFAGGGTAVPSTGAAGPSG